MVCNTVHFQERKCVQDIVRGWHTSCLKKLQHFVKPKCRFDLPIIGRSLAYL